MNFTLGQPFRPYQQLMGVLPDRSKRIVPTVYHDLMTDVSSPIIDFYPRDFELDKNGKKMDWEAVVKIPFIDERRLLNAMGPRDALLSQAEKDRNEFGVSLKFSYSPDASYTYPSSLAGIFPDLPNCHCVENIFDLPTMDGLDLHVGLMEGVKLGETALAGFPSLKTLPHTGTLDFHSVNVFQQDSRNESMVITLADAEERTKVEAAKVRLGQRVHVGYPFLSEAKIIRVSDEMFSYALPESGSGPPVATPHGPQELQVWQKKAERIESVYSKRLGMITGPVESLVHVDMLQGLKKTDEGASIKEYAQILGIETDYASQMVVDEVASEDQRFIEKAALPIEEEFPIGTRAFFLGDFNYGRPLEVVGHTSNKANIWVSIAKGKPREFGREIAMDAERHAPYTPSYAVARMLSLNPLVLSKLTSAFQVILEDGRVNLGLNLKFEAKKLKVLGYSRRTDSGWEFSQKAIELIKQYMFSFPDFIAGIQRNPQGKDYDATDFYPADEAKARMKEIQTWLKSIESRSFQKVPLEAEQLDSEAVHRIEQAADETIRNDPPGANQNKKINGVPRNGLLKPSDAEHRLSHQRFTIGDRIVYVQDSGRVPIATHGTVVGKTRTPRTTLLDVVFDVSFMSGTSLEERCSPFRGSTVPVHAVLNITDRQMVAGSRAGDNQRPQPVVRPLTVNGYGAPTGPNGQGQLMPAQAPRPLRGSFRSAVSGQQNGTRGGMSRGRGGSGYDGTPVGPPQNLPFRNRGLAQANGTRGRAAQVNGASYRGRGNFPSQQTTRGGYTRIDMNGSDEGVISNNPSFRPQSYTNVAPPANLDSRGRGRGRGGFRAGASRADGFRGRGAPRGRGLEAASQ
jgi:5'-3' exoribonuclease 1